MGVGRPVAAAALHRLGSLEEAQSQSHMGRGAAQFSREGVWSCSNTMWAGWGPSKMPMAGNTQAKMGRGPVAGATPHETRQVQKVNLYTPSNQPKISDTSLKKQKINIAFTIPVSILRLRHFTADRFY